MKRRIRWTRRGWFAVEEWNAGFVSYGPMQTTVEEGVVRVIPGVRHSHDDWRTLLFGPYPSFGAALKGGFQA